MSAKKETPAAPQVNVQEMIDALAARAKIAMEEYMALTQEQVDEIVAFILSIDKCYYYNESVMNIINEEMPAFYTGQKTAQEVAKTIQNRAQLYVDENR